MQKLAPMSPREVDEINQVTDQLTHVIIRSPDCLLEEIMLEYPIGKGGMKSC